MQLLLLEQDCVCLQAFGSKILGRRILLIYKSSTCLFFYQRTPLHIAAKEGFNHTVDSLVKKGANINIKDKKGVSGTGILKVD